LRVGATPLHCGMRDTDGYDNRAEMVGATNR
jgi:hypothetical protein